MNELHRRQAVAAVLLVECLLLVTACGAPIARGRLAPDPNAGGAVILVRTPRHVQAALKSAEALLEGSDGVPVATVQIVACDGAVAALVQDKDLIGAIERAHARGVRTVACGLSLDRLGIDRTALPPFVDVVPNGIIETLRLQALGFLSVEL
jgi:intracellular sulfur oxidation DsrE/DsrF family protein